MASSWRVPETGIAACVCGWRVSCLTGQLNLTGEVRGGAFGLHCYQ
jgi:hypothetical protein